MSSHHPLRQTAPLNGPDSGPPTLASILESERSEAASRGTRWPGAAGSLPPDALLAPFFDAVRADGSAGSADVGAARGRRLPTVVVLGALCALIALAKGGLVPLGSSTGAVAAGPPAEASAETAAGRARAVDTRQLQSISRTPPTASAQPREGGRTVTRPRPERRATPPPPSSENPRTNDEETPDDPTGVLPGVDVGGVLPVDPAELLPEGELPHVELVPPPTDLTQVSVEVPSLP